MINTIPLRVLIIEDHLIMSTALRLLLENEGNFCVVGEANSCVLARELMQRTQPDIVLLDLFLSDGESVLLIPDVLNAVPGVHVVVLTGASDSALHRRALTLGATGLVLKEQSAQALLAAIECVARGEVWIDPSLLAELMAPVAPTAPSPIELLTHREREIICAIGLGLRNKEIANRLFISERTVHNHLASIFRKLEVGDRLELALYAVNHGLLGSSVPVKIS